MQAFLAGHSSAANAVSETPTECKTDTVTRPWVEKYRPRTIDDIAHQEEAVRVLRNCVSNPVSFPNLLLYGKPGTGKTSAILAVARQLFGNLYKERVLELNASDERGIQVIREKVKTFSQLACANTSRSDGKPCPSFKLIILDEADSMTHAAQSALRRTMEKQSKNTRFCLICNYVSRIIDPITSRCMKFRFESLPERIMKSRLIDIASKEQITVTEDAVYSEIIKVTEGDMRKSITLLQSASRFSDEVSLDTIIELAGVVPEAVVDDLLAATKGSRVEELRTAVKCVLAEGYPAGQLLIQMAAKLLDDHSYTDGEKAVIFERIGVVDHRLNEGCDEYLQLLDLATTILTVNNYQQS